MPTPNLVDAQPVTAHLAHLRSQGVGNTLVARASGVAPGSLWRIGAGERKHVTARTAAKLLAVTADDAQPEYVDITEVRAHVRDLIARGMGVGSIADAVGMPRSTVTDIQVGSIRRVRRYTARRLLAVRYQPRATDLLDSTGTARRVQALAAIGYSQSSLIHELGISRSVLSMLARGRTLVTRKLAETVATGYVRLSDKPRTGHYADLARRRAVGQQWPPPAAWDEDAIDDPQAKPQWQWIRKADTKAGRPLHWVAEAEHLFLGRVSVPQIAAKFELTEQTVRDRLWKNPRCAAILRNEPTAKQLEAAEAA